MKTIALQLAAKSGDLKLNVLREYLQNEILFLMQMSGLSDRLYFVGGTALRFLYRIKRYSEDLDFSASAAWQKTKLPSMAENLKKDLEKAGYSVDIPVKEEKTVQRVMVKFRELLLETGLTERRGQTLSIHIEIDTAPPGGWREERTIVNIHMPILIRHYDKPSIYGAKLAAFLTRPYTKGRDIYDLFWLRSKWKDLQPNLEFLNNALAQKYSGRPKISEDNWLEITAARVEKLNWKAVVDDVAPFLEDPREVAALTKENLLLLYSR